jgi:hypothetical protein
MTNAKASQPPCRSGARRYHVLVCVAACLLLLGASPARAGLPERPALVHGQAFIDGMEVRATDDVTILARVPGLTNPVGRYHMGDLPGAGDDYLLKLRIESVVEGTQRSDDAAIIGDTIEIRLQQATGPEKKIAEFPLAGAGVIRPQTLRLDACTDDGECDDADACTTDHCVDEVCLFADEPDDTPCPDGLFCNGDESCQSGLCADGPDPCADPEDCDEQNDRCDVLAACCRDGVCEMSGEEECTTGCTRNPPWRCDGDVDGNGAVNPVDVGLVQAAFCSAGQCADDDLCQYDLDCNGAINPVDSGLVQSLFGQCDAPRASCGGGDWYEGEDCATFECP